MRPAAGVESSDGTVGPAHRCRQAAQIVEELLPLRNLSWTMRLQCGHAREEHIRRTRRVVPEGEHAIAGTRQRACGVKLALPHGFPVEASVDAPARFAPPRQPVPQRRDCSLQVVFAAPCAPRPQRLLCQLRAISQDLTANGPIYHRKTTPIRYTPLDCGRPAGGGAEHW